MKDYTDEIAAEPGFYANDKEKLYWQSHADGSITTYPDFAAWLAAFNAFNAAQAACPAPKQDKKRDTGQP